MTARNRLVAGALALALLPTAAACGGGHRKAASTSAPPTATTTSSSPSPTPSPTKRPPRPHAVSPLTGLAAGTGRPVMAVKIENTPAGRPQIGLNQADVVYMEQVEGGLTRLLAVYCSQVPSVVGPVRSARENDLELLGAYGRVPLVYSGANAGVVHDVRRANVVDVSPDTSGAFFRMSGRHAPYNLMVHLPQVLAAHAHTAPAHDVGFRFGALPHGARTASSVSVPMSGFVRVAMRWHGGHYVEVVNGAVVHDSTGAPVWTDNVLVQAVQVGRDRFVDVRGNPTPYTHTVGHGVFWLLRDGHVEQGTWRRTTAGGATSWRDAHGNRVGLKPGRTWVLMMPSSGSPAFG